MLYIVLHHLSMEQVSERILRCYPGLKDIVRLVDYLRIGDRASWPQGIYLFTECSLFEPEQRSLLVEVEERLDGSGLASKILNRPSAVLPRSTGLAQIGRQRRPASDAGMEPPVALVGERLGRVREMRADDRQSVRDALVELAFEGYDQIWACEDLEGATLSCIRIGNELLQGWLGSASPQSGALESQQIRRLFDSCGIDVGRADFVLENGALRVVRIDDSPFSFLPDLGPGQQAEPLRRGVQDALRLLDRG